MTMCRLHRGFSSALARMSRATHRRPPAHEHRRLDSLATDAARSGEIRATPVTRLEFLGPTEWQHRLLMARGNEIYTTSISHADRCAIAILDTRGIVIAWHDYLPNARSYDRSVVTHHMSQFYLAQDNALHIPARHLSMATAQGVSTQIGWRRRPGGEVFWGVTIIQAVLLNEGELLGYSHITRPLRGPAQALPLAMRVMPRLTARMAMA